jgi:hypothetical protein
MAEYRKYSELVGATLEYGDTVFLGSHEYKVRQKFLSNIGGFNCQIFQDLHIDNITEFCSKAYGYRAKEGCSWPECLPDDYSALKKCALAIYKIIESIKEKEQWYKITTPGKTGISPEQVKELILKYEGLIDSDLTYTSDTGIYVWTKNKKTLCLPKCDVRKDAIEVFLTTEITTTKKEEKYETQFQRKKARIKRGTRPEGNSVCGRRSKASVAVGHLGYRKVTGI